ncbi:MAG TPA: hypothetical protein VFN13_08170 [Rudaea sp.]|nr:hypothetical protein [Rudaea sp.]
MRAIGFTLMVMLAIASFSTLAIAAEKGNNHYKWTDAQGHLHFDDALPVEALQFGYDVISPSGLTIKHVDRTKTPEERKADEQARAIEAKRKHALDEQNRVDQQILVAYPTERELVIAQQAQLDMLNQNIGATQVSLESQEKSLSEMLEHAADLERSGKPVSAALSSQIEALRKNVEQQKAYIASKQEEKTAAAEKFVKQIEHYRQIKAQQHP